MRHRLPPLNALRAFEVAARHLSFSKAAEELNVTPAAVSHQVKALEEDLGVALFKRLNRAVLLTDEAQSYLPGVQEGFSSLIRATEKLRAREGQGALTVSLLPSFAARWLVPRLRRFQILHPDIELRLATNDRLTDFAREDVDLCIRYGNGRYPGLRADLLMTEDMYPVCSPSLLEGGKPLSTPDDLRHHTLLHDDMREDWGMWLLAAGVEGVDPRPGPAFTDSSLLLQAAIEGQGVALGRSALTLADLEAGRLVKPFDISIAVSHAYFVVYPEPYADRPKIKAFRDWVLSEAKPEKEG